MDASAVSCHFVPVFPYRPELPRKKPQVPQPITGFPPLPDSWLVEFETFDTEDRAATLFGHLFRPKEVAPDLSHRAVFILHGQGEHGGRYIHWPHYLESTVGSIYALDHRGHGQSTGIRGHIPRFDLYAHDAAFAICRYANYLKSRYGKADIHLVGHSMGGLIALRTALLHPELPIHSLTLSAPMIDLAFKLPKAKLLAGRVLNQVLPALPLPSANLSDLISRDPAVVLHYKRDKLNHGFASSAFYFSYLKVRADTLARAGEIRQPLLLLLPLGDRIIDPIATQNFFKGMKGPNKKLVEFPRLYHETFNEPEKEQAFSELKNWIGRYQQ